VVIELFQAGRTDLEASGEAAEVQFALDERDGVACLGQAEGRGQTEGAAAQHADARAWRQAHGAGVGVGGVAAAMVICQVKPPAVPLASRTRTRTLCVPLGRFWLVWMAHSRGECLSICAPASAPLTDSEAEARSAPRPMSTAESVTGAPAGTCAF